MGFAVAIDAFPGADALLAGDDPDLCVTVADRPRRAVGIGTAVRAFDRRGAAVFTATLFEELAAAASRLPAAFGNPLAEVFAAVAADAPVFLVSVFLVSVFGVSVFWMAPNLVVAFRGGSIFAATFAGAADFFNTAVFETVVFFATTGAVAAAAFSAAPLTADFWPIAFVFTAFALTAAGGAVFASALADRPVLAVLALAMESSSS